MAIDVKCLNCEARFVAKDEHAGRRGRCPKCRAPIQVPGNITPPGEQDPGATATSAAIRAGVRPVETADGAGKPHSVEGVADQSLSPAQQRASLKQELLAAFQGDIQRVQVPILYRCGIILSALVMILLPLAYLAIIGAAGLAVYYHATSDTDLLSMGSGRGRLVMVLIYFAPIIVGLILIFFMLKPLFARPVMMGRTRTLTRQGEPVLFAFVDRVCEAVGARPPARIRVDWQLNASAGFDEGWFHLFSKRLVLTIGTPLVAGLDVSEFAGVLAHEFGHFTQGAGRRMTYLVRSISHWLMRVVYQRDTWDQWLAESAQEWDMRIGWILYLSLLCVWLSRRVLWVFMMIGHLVSSFLLRQMEFHADAHEARLVGGEVFESTSRKIELLTIVYESVFRDLDQFVRRGLLPDNAPQLLLAKYRQCSPEELSRLDRKISERRTGWLDTHPSPQDRIRNAHREGAAAVFVDHRPAADLFTDFKALSRHTTEDLYRASLGSQFPPSLMRPIEDLVESDE